VRRIAGANAAERANELLEDELRVYRDLRLQLLRQKLLLQCEAEGITLPMSGGPATDGRVEQLMREVDQLKAEVQRLSARK
jgi:predicted metal-dependent hydrolase